MHISFLKIKERFGTDFNPGSYGRFTPKLKVFQKFPALSHKIGAIRPVPCLIKGLSLKFSTSYLNKCVYIPFKTATGLIYLKLIKESDSRLLRRKREMRCEVLSRVRMQLLSLFVSFIIFTTKRIVHVF